MKYLYILPILVTSLIVGILVFSRYIDQNKKELCFYNGNFYSPGEDYDADDGCNFCIYGDDGKTVCTEKLCYEKSEDSKNKNVCEYDGKIYEIGDSIEVDNCNSCTCQEGGLVACTLIACDQVLPE